MTIRLSDILFIYKENDLNSFLKKLNPYTLEEKNLTFGKVSSNWKFLGNSSSNGSTVQMLKTGEKGLIERITNAIDAVIEKQKDDNNIATAKYSSVIIKKAFPKFYETIQKISLGESDSLNAKDASDQVIVAVNDGSKSNKPTIDVIDHGTGIKGIDFDKTILSIAHGNKLSKDKSYLIGAFGQGGSTSLPFSYGTIVLSKINGKYYFTVIKAADLEEYKNIVYLYLCDNNGNIYEVEDDSPDVDDYLNTYINNDSGTMIRMIEMDISKRFRDNEITKPGMLSDYINTELFSVGLPVKIIDNRLNYVNNAHSQNRYAYGSFNKLQTSKYLRKDYSGTLKIIHNDKEYNIDYYILLPKDESKWGSEYECKKVFEQFNVYYDPIIYTVNGQMITTERFTKLNNAGLNFLKYRLLVTINLDVLGTEKYKFFTSDRSQIKNTDLTRGFLDKVIYALSQIDKLKEINTIIAEKSINSSIDQALLDDLSKEVKGQYEKYLKSGNLLPSTHNQGNHYTPDDEEIYDDHISQLDITSSKRQFYIDQTLNFVVTTKAQKHVNSEAMIYMFIDDKQNYDFSRNVMNGRISYAITGGKVKAGTHTIQFMYFSNNRIDIKSEKAAFEILNEKTPDKNIKQPEKSLDLNIIIKDEATLICDVSKNKVDKKITVFLCLDTDELRSEVYGLQKSADDIALIKNKLIKPISLFGLFYSDYYEKIESDEEKNRLILTFIKSFILSID